MAGELNIPLASGQTVKALILGPARTQRWDGTNVVAISSVTDLNWATGMITCPEETTFDGTGTGNYAGDFPTGITTAGEYVVRYYVGAAPAPGDQAQGVQAVPWNGTAMVSPTDGMALTAAERNSVADAVLVRGASNVEATADRHSLGALIMITTNSVVVGATLTAKKPSDDTTFATYTVVVDASADPITGVS